VGGAPARTSSHPTTPIFAEFRSANFFRTHLILYALLDRSADLSSVTLAELSSSDPSFMDDLRDKINALARRLVGAAHQTVGTAIG
jgi:hypothetical protein